MKFNKDLSSVHAYLCSDGYVIKNPETQKHKYYYIGLRNTNLTLLKDFQNKFQKIFGIKPYITKDGRCRIQNKKVYLILTQDFSYYSNKWVLPNLSKSNLKEWLRSFFDCEAWVYLKKHKNRHIGLDSINQKGIFCIKDALFSFGIRCKLKFIKKREIYRLYIYGKDNLIKFDKNISFLSKEKNQRLKEAIHSYVDHNWDFNNFKSLFKKKAKSRKKMNVVRLISKLKSNLKPIEKTLNDKYNIQSKIYKRINGLGTTYYELAIYGKQNINILKHNGLIKWR